MYTLEELNKTFQIGDLRFQLCYQLLLHFERVDELYIQDVNFVNEIHASICRGYCVTSHTVKFISRFYFYVVSGYRRTMYQYE